MLLISHIVARLGAALSPRRDFAVFLNGIDISNSFDPDRVERQGARA
jgi:hypothetical protein